MALGFPYILSRIQRVKQRWQAVSITEGLLAFAATVLALILLFAGTEAVFHFGWIVRLVMLIFSLAVLLTAALVFIFWPILRIPSDEEVALLVEAEVQGVRNGLINALRLSKDRQVASVGMVEAAMREIAGHVQKMDFAPSIHTRRCFWLGISAAALALAMVGFMVLFPARLKNALMRLANPAGDIPALGQVLITNVEPGDISLIAGSDLKVRVTIERATQAAVQAALFYTLAEARENAVPMSPQGDNVFEYEVPDVRVDLVYHVRIGGSESRRYKVAVVEPPLVTRIDLQYEYPPYTGLPPATVDNSDGNIEAVKGSAVSLRIATNKKIKDGYLRFDVAEQQKLNVGVDGLSSTVRLSIQKDDGYRIFVTDEQGYTNRDPVPHAIKAAADQPPLVKILEPAKDTTVPLDGALKLAVRGSDDFGVASLKLLAKVNNAETAALVKEWKDFADPRTASVNWEWPFPAKQYKVGDLVSYYVEVVDNCPSPNTAKSQEYKLTVEAAQKVAEELKQKYSDWEARLDRVLKLQREARQDAGQAAEEK